MLRMGWMLLLVFALVLPAQAGEEIFLRHALTGKAQDALTTLVLRFNDEYKTKLVLQDLRGIDEPGRLQLPLMALLDADESTEFFGTRPRFRPLFQVMAESREKLDAKRFFPLIADTVDDPVGRIQALPLGMSLPVLMWNKEFYRKAGLDPEKAAKTWWEVQAHAGSLFDAGFKCPLTSSRFTWVHLENLSAQHGEPVGVREKNGITKIALNRLIDVKHIALLTSWYKSSYFKYFGPGSESDKQFISGRCAMYTGESSLYVEAINSGMAVGLAALPYYDDVRDATPSKVSPDGAALWVLAGRKKADYQLAARFVSFMLRPQIQMEWVRTTGYLPMTPAVIEALKRTSTAPAMLDAASRRLSERPTAKMITKLGANSLQVREILNEEIASVWANVKPAKEALDSAMNRVNDSKAFPVALPPPGR